MTDKKINVANAEKQPNVEKDESDISSKETDQSKWNILFFLSYKYLNFLKGLFWSGQGQVISHYGPE